MENNTNQTNNQDSLLIVNELKKISQKLTEIQENNLENKHKIKIVQYCVIVVSSLLFIGLFSNLIRERYEYQVVSPSDYVFDEKMNEYGQLGWKATDCRRATSGSSYLTTASYECIMIRKK